MSEKRAMQAFGREELASPMAEAWRRTQTVSDAVFKTCENCEHYWKERNWCAINNTSTTTDDSCDEYKKQ